MSAKHVVHVSVDTREWFLEKEEPVLIRLYYISADLADPPQKAHGSLWHSIRGAYARGRSGPWDIVVTPFFALNAIHRLHHAKRKNRGQPDKTWRFSVEVDTEAKRYLEDAAAEKIAHEGARAGRYVNLFWKPTPNL